MTKFNNVDRPAHYAEGRSFEPIAVIEDWELNYHLGNALKYISRAGRKIDAIEDLRKAVWYIERHISTLEDQVTTLEEENEPKFSFPAIEARRAAIIAERDAAGLPDLWDTDEQWMVRKPDTYEHSEYYYDYDRNRPYAPECGWDPSVGPTC